MMATTGMLDPYQAPPKTDNEDSKDLQPTEEERKLAKQIDSLFEKYAKYRRKYDKDWVDNYKMFRGEQWLKKRPAYKHKEVINLIFQTVQSQASVMLDPRPIVGFTPTEPSDMAFSEILNKVFEADWDKNNWSDELTANVFDAHIYSIGYGYTGYNKDTSRIEWCAKDCFEMYPDPDATNVNKKCEGFIWAEPIDVDKLKKEYAGHKYVNQIKADLDDLSFDKRKVETLFRYKQTDLDITPEKLVSGTSTINDRKDQALKICCYLKPSDTEEIEKDDLQADGEKVYITKLKYPRGRKVVKINGLIFEDTELPYDHLEFPFQRLLNYVLPREYYGISEIENTRGPQMTFNKLVNFALDVMTMMGNPIWMVPTNSGVNPRKLISQPGLIVEHAPEGAPTRVEGVQLQPYVLQLIDRMEKWFNDEAGTQDVTRGVNPTGVTANAAIENLLEQAQKRIKQKMRNMDSYLKDFGRQYVSLVMQFYTAPQVFRLTNKEGVNEYFRFHIENQDSGEVSSIGKPLIQKVAKVTKYIPNEVGTLVPDKHTDEYQIRGDFDVKVNTISGLGFSKQADEQKLLNLFDRGIIDAEEVLKKSEYPNYENVLARVKQQAAQTAEQQPPPK